MSIFSKKKVRLSPERTEEICQILESHLRFGKEIAGYRPSFGPSILVGEVSDEDKWEAMVSKLSPEVGVPAKELKKFFTKITRHIYSRLRMARRAFEISQTG